MTQMELGRLQMFGLQASVKILLAQPRLRRGRCLVQSPDIQLSSFFRSFPPEIDTYADSDLFEILTGWFPVLQTHGLVNSFPAMHLGFEQFHPRAYSIQAPSHLRGEDKSLR